jgi:hypothetical protein
MNIRVILPASLAIMSGTSLWGCKKTAHASTSSGKSGSGTANAQVVPADGKPVDGAASDPAVNPVQN